jgi:transposase
MKLHANAALTLKQREEVQKLHNEGLSYRKIAERFGVNLSTIVRWMHRDSPLDLSSAPIKKRSGLNKNQKEAILEYRKENPGAGARTIATVLAGEYGTMSHATISRYLKEERLSNPLPRKARKEKEPLKVGKHRLQMDIQTLPAVRGGEKFEYKITIIHMATRMKYSEIHPSVTSETIAQAVRNALSHMPPFFFNMD